MSGSEDQDRESIAERYSMDAVYNLNPTNFPVGTWAMGESAAYKVLNWTEWVNPKTGLAEPMVDMARYVKIFDPDTLVIYEGHDQYDVKQWAEGRDGQGRLRRYPPEAFMRLDELDTTRVGGEPNGEEVRDDQEALADEQKEEVTADEPAPTRLSATSGNYSLVYEASRNDAPGAIMWNFLVDSRGSATLQDMVATIRAVLPRYRGKSLDELEVTLQKTASKVRTSRRAAGDGCGIFYDKAAGIFYLSSNGVDVSTEAQHAVIISQRTVRKPPITVDNDPMAARIAGVQAQPLPDQTNVIPTVTHPVGSPGDIVGEIQSCTWANYSGADISLRLAAIEAYLKRIADVLDPVTPARQIIEDEDGIDTETEDVSQSDSMGDRQQVLPGV